MSQPINLMPLDYRRRLGDHLIRRRFILAYAAVAAMSVLYAGHARARAWDLERERDRLGEQVVQLDALRDKTLALTAEADAEASRLAQYHRIALPIEPSRVIATVTDLMPESLVLTDLRLWLVEKAESKSAMESIRSGAGSSDESATLRRTLHAELSGLALSDMEIAAFLGALENHRLFAKVQMDYARSKDVAAGSVREFRISFQIDGDARYVAVADSTGGGDE